MQKGGIIIELKTLYGFTSGLFPVVADARVGFIGQVDIREYFVPGGHRPVDKQLVDRVIRVLDALLLMKASDRGYGGYIDLNKEGILNKNGKKRMDAISGPSIVSPELNNILGPNVSDVKQICQGMALNKFRLNILNEPKDELHCALCSPFNE
jgi:hypothetical protein